MFEENRGEVGGGCFSGALHQLQEKKEDEKVIIVLHTIAHTLHLQLMVTRRQTFSYYEAVDFEVMGV